MFKLFLTSIFAVFCGFSAYAQDGIMYQDFQTIYTDTPVQSYYAYPDDPNFIPETEFMERAYNWIKANEPELRAKIAEAEK